MKPHAVRIASMNVVLAMASSLLAPTLGTACARTPAQTAAVVPEPAVPPTAPAPARTPADERAAPSPKPAAVAVSPPARDTVKPSSPKPAPSPQLDFTSLVERLRGTKAVGVLTKLSLKNQIDDLLDEFKLFHQGRGPALGTLRERYDLLLMKVLSLLQNDPGLARDVGTSREAIWGILADPVKFARLV